MPFEKAGYIAIAPHNEYNLTGKWCVVSFKEYNEIIRGARTFLNSYGEYDTAKEAQGNADSLS